MNIPTILVTGGAGYIAAPVIVALTQKNYHVLVLDRKPITEFYLPELLLNKKATYIHADYADTLILKSLCRKYPIVACMHFAALAEVGESVISPHLYYENNVSKTITLLHTLIQADIKRFIFSSSCSVYGPPQYLPLDEQHPRNPLSPYAKTKMTIEMALEDYAHAYGFQYACLRYFNAAGALPERNLGERHNPESHLIPRALEAAYTGTPFKIFGNDYPTADGTCVRDYLHIADIASAHDAALSYLLQHSNSITCNLGTGTGYSVQQIIMTIEHITGQKIKKIIAPRRAGDAASLVAHFELAHKILGWQPCYSNLENIISTAHTFHTSMYREKNIAIATANKLA